MTMTMTVTTAMMKVMIKGLAKDEMTLRTLGVVKGAKVMVVGSSLNDVLKVSTTKDAAAGASSSSTAEEEQSEDKVTTCRLKQHKKVLDMGKPDDVMVAIKGIQQPQPLTGQWQSLLQRLSGGFLTQQGPGGIGKGRLKALQQPLIHGQIGGGDRTAAAVGHRQRGRKAMGGLLPPGVGPQDVGRTPAEGSQLGQERLLVDATGQG